MNNDNELNDKMKETLKSLGITPEEYLKSVDSFVEKWVKEELEKQKKKDEFISSKQINIVIEKIYTYFKSGQAEVIDSDDFFYRPEVSPITEDEFYLFFNVISEYGRMLNLICQEEHNSFPHEGFCMTYKDIRLYLRVMSGQGTCYQIWYYLPNDKDWCSNMEFTFSSLGTLPIDL